MSTFETIKKRRSVRTFDGRALSDADAERIITFAKTAGNPYGIPIEFSLLSSEKGDISSAVIVGADTYIVGKVKKTPHAEEAFGFSLEATLLFAESLGVGNVWLAGTFDRKSASSAIGLEEDEIMPAVSPLGYTAAKMSVRESVMRKGTKADSRLPFEELFFGADLSPLKKDDAGTLAEAFEAVRLAPSAVNRQPWRVVYDGSAAHFYKASSKQTGNFDMHKIDMGIAMCHFDAVLTDCAVPHEFSICDPKTDFPGAEYIATYILK